jgi:uncharacterized membrane protein YtjA (UPF0391 family)
MLYWAAVFFIIAIVAAGVAKVLFVVFLVLAGVSLLLGNRRVTT